MRKVWFSFLSVYTVPSPLYVADPDTMNHDHDKRTSTPRTQCCSLEYGSGSRLSSEFGSYCISRSMQILSLFFIDQNFRSHSFLKSMFDQDWIITYRRPVSRQERHLGIEISKKIIFFFLGIIWLSLIRIWIQIRITPLTCNFFTICMGTTMYACVF